MIFEFKNMFDFLCMIDKSHIVGDKIKYYNLAFSFDIETYSFYKNNYTNKYYTNNDIKNNPKIKAEKQAIMYIWQFAYNNNVIYGRTWSEYVLFCNNLKHYLDLSAKKRIIVYVHNLSYEYQFICQWFNWHDIFATEKRKPLKVVCENGIEYRCSYRLSGYSLDTLSQQLGNVKKLVGNLDYDIARNSKTVLSQDELNYCVNDVLIITNYINSMINDYGSINNIPLTQTGKIRRVTREKCFRDKKYKLMIKNLTLEYDEYLLLQNAFCGGFTHCSAMYSNITCNDVTSYDFTSSYPCVMIAEKYPMGKGCPYKINNNNDIMELLHNNYAFIIDITLYNVESNFLWEHIISYSKCRNVQNVKVDNGRIISADRLTLSCTDIDFVNFAKFYKWGKIEYGQCYIYKKDYLPKPIIDTILQLYNDKTKLKGVTDKEKEYLHAKELLNSVYGMTVTSIVHDLIEYKNNEWIETLSDVKSEIEKYNKDKNRFLYYLWGVYVTAYARNNLYSGILECKDDYIYSDTDSIKIMNAENHKEYIENYNSRIIEKLNKCLDYYKIEHDLIEPKTIKGDKKILGVWDYDGHYKKFKSLGAKRYIVQNDKNEIKITVCGLSKKKGNEYFSKLENPFSFFIDGAYIDSNYTGKLTHTYIDTEIEGLITDYQGNIASYHEKSYIHLEHTDYLLTLNESYADYINSLHRLQSKSSD